MEEYTSGRVPIPCVKDCPNRSPFCHGECEKYATYARYRRMIYQKRLYDFEANALESESIRKGRRRSYIE